jgi:hypothetical protein
MEMKVKQFRPPSHFWATCYNPIVKSGEFFPQSKKKQSFGNQKRKQKQKQINPGPTL